MKGISAPLIESIAFFLAIAFLALLFSISNSFILNNSKIIEIQKTCVEKNKICFDGYSFLGKEQLEASGFKVIGSGSRIAIYLNEQGALVARLT